ncbi:MAG: hypothetical protein ABWW66_04735 [Archaeoglobaceae archaeon]
MGQTLKKYLQRPLTPIPDEHRDIIERGKDMPPDGVLKFEEKDKLLDDSMQYENGFYHFPDGRAYVACLTRMPGVTVEMLCWWFRWHSKDPIRYQIWYPGMHFHVQADETGFTHYVVEDIGTGRQRLVIRFMTPADFGFSRLEKLDFSRNAIICARVGTAIPKHIVWHTWMCHYAKEVEWGVELRSRFWIGWDMKVSGPLAPILTGVVRRMRKRVIPKDVGRHMFHHCAQEYHHLAAILPEIYEEFGD